LSFNGGNFDALLLYQEERLLSKKYAIVSSKSTINLSTCYFHLFQISISLLLNIIQAILLTPLFGNLFQGVITVFIPFFLDIQ
jgi:hypothetical protein